MPSTFATVSKRVLFFRRLFAGFGALALVFTLSISRPWDLLEFKIFDVFTTLSATGKGDDRLVILAIDEPTFQELEKQWPFPRSFHAKLLDRLTADGATAVAFDVVFAEPSSPIEDNSFAKAISRSKHVILASSTDITESNGSTLWTEVLPAAGFLSEGAITGDARVIPDDDFVIRHLERSPSSLAAKLAASSGHPIAETEEPPRFIEYAGPSGTIPTYSYYQALIPGLLPAGFFKDKLVLIGRGVRTASGTNHSSSDAFNSPFGILDHGNRLIHGVEIHANMALNHLTGGGISPLNAVFSWIFLTIALLTMANLQQRISPLGIALLTGGLVVCLGLLSYFLFSRYKLWLPPLTPALGTLSLAGAITLVEFVAARHSARETRLMFSQYVPPDVVNQLIERPELMRLGGVTRRITLMFTDLANFTAMSELLSPEDTVEVLTDYFNEMTACIHRHGGTVDKFIGDAVMAFWGAPLDDPLQEERAVRAAIEMHAAMPFLVARLIERGLPPINMRIGIHTGDAVVGNVGAASRFSYTAIGDAVNLAARLEGANKAFDTNILISGETAAKLPEELRIAYIDRIIVKGKTDPIDVFTLARETNLLDIRNKALALFFAHKFDESLLLLNAVISSIPNEKTALRIRERLLAVRDKDEIQSSDLAIALDKL